MLKEVQIKFCEEYVANGFNGAAAYKVSYTREVQGVVKVPSDNVSAVEAHRMLANIKIIDKIKEIEGAYRIMGHKVGVNKQMIMEAIKRMILAKKKIYYEGKEIDEVDDYIAVNNGITTYAKLTGDFTPEKKELTIDDQSEFDVTKLSSKQRDEYKAKILAEL